MAFLEVKGALAKLLATENLYVQHDAVATTASFNTATRTLTLPILSTESSHVYDMFVGHEVGHALYTPVDWRDHVDESVPFDFVNVIEDARIEKAIQDKFPGLRTDFNKGYTELNDKDFFDIADKDVSQLNLIDRINLHFKLGARAVMPFTPEEMVYVRAVEDANTFDKVCLCAKMIADYVDAKRQEEDNKQVVPMQGNGAGEQETDTPQDNVTEGDTSEPGEQPKAQEGESKDSTDDKVSETQRAMDEALKDLASNDDHQVNYIVAPKKPLPIYPLEFLRDDFSGEPNSAAYIVHEKCDKFLASIKRDVNFMAQQFEMKKSADAYARQQIHKTGVLNTNVLHNYKLTDDLFMRQTVVPDGKNHGLLMLIDWSGSMSDNIVATVKQLLVLVSFCRKVGIPFDVYTFTAQGYDLNHYDNLDEYEGGEILTSGCMVTHVLTSKAKRREIDADMRNLYSQAHKLEYPYSGAPYSNRLSMGGTPLNNVLMAMPPVIEEFKKQNNVQKVSFVCLTDGESSPLAMFSERDYYGRVTMSNPYYTNLLRDGNKVHQLDCRNETPSIVNYLTQKMPDVSITNIYLAGPKGALSYKRHLTGQPVYEMLEYKKSGAETFTTSNGWPLVALVNPRSFTDPSDEIEVEQGASKAKVKSALRKFLKTKTTSKMLLSTLVDQFS